MTREPKWVQIYVETSTRNAIVVISCAGIAAFIGKNQPFSIVGHIIPGIPKFEPPPFQIFDPKTNSTHTMVDILKEEGSAIIVIPLLAIMEHITIAKAFAGSAQIDGSQEMISIGISNLIGSFFSSMPVTGSFSRTTVNQMSGAKTPLGGLLTGTMVLLALGFLTPYFYYIPNASLAAVIVCAVIFTVDIQVIKPMWRAKKMDFIPWGLTFLVSLLVGLEFGMMTGFTISVIYLLYYAARPGVKVRRGYTGKGNEFILVEMDRSCTFPSVEYIRYVISKSATSWGKCHIPMVVDCVHIQFVDYTAAVGIHDLINQFNKRDQAIILWKVKPSLVRMLHGVMGEFVHCRDEEDLEELIDGASRRITIDVQTPHPGQREKFSSIPLS
ncbi:unnamed protein product [Allacma fusca]|uniref:SLC26A/SulP transporter domain-containing protein n=1 Tax=Allacma fusca TaxID=39272 RepID=A0A8J2JJL7_9HEXA|nr:unnamed protein product [Allacma fusca]